MTTHNCSDNHSDHDDDSLSVRDRDDPIFQSIMDSTFDTETTTTEESQHHDQYRPPVHSPHPHIPGLVLHTHVLTHQDQSRLMDQITTHNFFKGGQQNQAMCFGPKELVWIQALEDRLWETGVLREPYCASSWTKRTPLFDQSIMNLYQPGERENSSHLIQKQITRRRVFFLKKTRDVNNIVN
jgi:hypothetical protein